MCKVQREISKNAPGRTVIVLGNVQILINASLFLLLPPSFSPPFLNFLPSYVCICYSIWAGPCAVALRM